jgi:hypothetical protein
MLTMNEGACVCVLGEVRNTLKLYVVRRICNVK